MKIVKTFCCTLATSTLCLAASLPTYAADMSVNVDSYVTVTNSQDLVLPEGALVKSGYGVLVLTGYNTFSANPRISAGVIQADFGQGLDVNYGVDMFGGWLGSIDGTITSVFGGIPVNPKLPMSFGVDSAAFARAADGRLTANGATESRSR